MNLKHTALATLLCSSAAFAAIPYKNEQNQFTQPNGEVITLTLNGNSYYAEQRTADGRLVVFDNALKGMAYAKLNDEGSKLISTGMLVSTKSQQGIQNVQLRVKQAGLSTEAKQRLVEAQQQRMLGEHDTHTHSVQSRMQTTQIDAQISGQVKGLTIIIDFPDERGTISKAQIERFLNDANYTEFGNAQSVRGYFIKVAGG